MKKISFLLLVTLILVSCQGPQGVEGPQGYGTNWKIINLVGAQKDWVQNLDDNGLNRYYSCNYNMPEINSTVFNDGNVTVYYVENGVQQPLPYVRHFQNTAGNFWTRTIDYDYSVGKLNIYVTNSDFAVDAPATMNFRAVLMW